MEVRGVSNFIPSNKASKSKSIERKEAGINPSDTVYISNAKSSKSIKKVNLQDKKQENIDSEIHTKATYLASASTSGVISGGIGGAMQTVNTKNLLESLKALKEKGIEFYKEKSWHIPFFTGKFEKITPKKAFQEISSGKSINVKTPKAIMLPLEEEKDVKELVGFYVLKSTENLENSELAQTLMDLSKNGVSLQNESGEEIGPYGAYNYLTDGWKKSGISPSRVNVIRNGVSLMYITPSMAKDNFQVMKRLKDSWDAYQKLEGLKGGLLEKIGKPIGETSLGERYESYETLHKTLGSNEDALNMYNIISNLTEKGENFKDLAKLYCDVYTGIYGDSKYGDQMEALRAFNYIRSTLKGKKPLQDAFLKILSTTQNASDAVKGLELITKPVGKESFYERRDVLYNLLETTGKEAIEDYEVISRNVYPNESLKDAADEYIQLRKEIAKFHYENIHQTALEGFEYARKKYSKDSEKRKAFLKIYPRITVESKTDELVNSLPLNDNANVIYQLLDLESPSWVSNDLEMLREESRLSGKDFNDVANLYIGVFKALFQQEMKEYGKTSLTENDRKDLKQAFYFGLRDLNADSSKTSTYIKLLKLGKTHTDGINAYRYIQNPIGNEDYETRKDAMLKLMELDGDAGRALQTLKALQKYVKPNKNIKEVTYELAKLHNSIWKGNLEYEKDLDKTLQTYEEIRTKYGDDDSTFKKLVDIVYKVKDLDKARKALNILLKPVSDETYEEREQIFVEILKSIQNREKAPDEAMESYKTIRDLTPPKGDIHQTYENYKRLSDVLNGTQNPDKVRDAIKFVYEEVKKGTFKNKSVKEATEMMVKSLLISDSLEDAKEYLLAKYSPEKYKIEKGDGYVIIGKLKLPVRKR